MIDRNQKKIFLILLLLFVFCFLLSVAGCGRKEEQVKELIPVRVMPVKLQDIKKTLDYVGDIKAQNEAIVYPKVSGKIIEKLKEDGNPINKQEVIAYIDRDEVGFKFEDAPVESPLTGIIGRVYVDKGVSVTPQTPIALVVDMDKIKVELDIPERYLSKIALGQLAEIKVDAYPSEVFKGEVSKISPVVELETRTAPIEILIPNEDHRLKSGMFAQANLVIDKRKAVPVILKEALSGKEPNTYVYVIKESNAYKRNIELGLRQGAYYEVLEGLKEGELVVIMGQQKLHNGVGVSIEEKER
jgi:multidrug efflux pump subunit AcrA (membrane-fusion protein)